MGAVLYYFLVRSQGELLLQSPDRLVYSVFVFQLLIDILQPSTRPALLQLDLLFSACMIFHQLAAQDLLLLH